ncbi:MAG: endonuclease/exonuclease/phosphatase family protein [Steroidobacteraceae bacterium]|nr:endonuclease/exonuclease/phosphatase family protein [Steroidobacteraceae bacterium]
MTRRWIVIAACALAASASADEWVGREQVNATLWMQTAPEYRALSEQIYRLATQKILAPAPGSAAVEQSTFTAEALAKLPTAVVLDLDETVLDNSVYQAQRIRAHEEYDSASWGEWVAAGKADLVPGAREFLDAARRVGHTIFFITNRDCKTPAPTATDPCPAKTATLRNLVTLGVDLAPDPAKLLIRGEKPEWVSGKTTRRAYIAANYRIVALVGDDLGDFVDPRTFAGDRDRLSPRFGETWFLLPNPIYGSWTDPYKTIEQKYAGLHAADSVHELPGGGVWKRRDRVVVASWNVEYLMTPATHIALSDRCAKQGGIIRGNDRTLPCAITEREPRSDADYAALRKYAAKLSADIVALQEVDGPDAASLVFPGYDFCFSQRAHTQKNGFAIRRGLPFRCEAEYEPLSVDDAVRNGVIATFFPGTVNEFRLMSVHLKSGCPAGPLTAEGRNCDLISKQVAPLEAWIDGEARAGRRFGVLGDFNRRFSIEKGPAKDESGRQLNVFAEIDDGDPAAAKLLNVTAREKFTPCTTDSEFREFIDTILLGRDLAKSVVRKSFLRVVFDDTEAKERVLSDHCPVGIGLKLR